MPAFSLSLFRHRLAARKQARGARDPEPEIARPEGRVLWVHIGRGAEAEGARIVVDGLAAQHPGLSVHVTGEPGRPGPADTPAAARAFLPAWRPDLALFIGNDLFPVLWSEALAAGIPLFGAEIDPAGEPLPMVRPLADFDGLITLAPDPRLGAVVEDLGPLARIPPSPETDGARLAAVSERLATRPAWLALDVTAPEIPLVLDAHRLASRTTHRLLLILCTRGAVDRAVLEAGAWKWRAFDPGDLPGPECQVLLCEPPVDAGLWLRVAPVTFLGGTLDGEGPASSPFAPASLGSALIHGPRLHGAAAAAARLHAERAARRVTSARHLGTEVERLLNPDIAAELARAGWVVTSEGATASARLFEMLDDALAGIGD